MARDYGDEGVKRLFASARNLEYYGLSVSGLLKPAVKQRLDMDGNPDPLGDAKDAFERRFMESLLTWWGVLTDRVIARVRGIVPVARKQSEEERLAALLERIINKEWFDIQWRELAVDDLRRLAEMAYATGETYWQAWLTEQSETGGFAFDEKLVPLDAAAWAQEWADTTMRGFGITTYEGIGNVLSLWATTPGADMGMLEQALMDSFQVSESRARIIAVTETTRAIEGGTQRARDRFEEATGGAAVMVAVWYTRNIEDVCETCRPRHGKEWGDGWEDFPPAHVGCHCWTRNTVVVRDAEAMQQLALPGMPA